MKFVGVVMAEAEIIAGVAIEDGAATISVENATTGRTAAVGAARRDATSSVPTMAIPREPHPWNDGFSWTPHQGPFTTITEEQARRFDDDGFFVIDDAFDAATLAALDEAIAPGEERARGFLEGLPGGRFGVAGADTQTIAPHLVVRSDVLREFCAHPLLAGLCRDLVGPDVRLYWDQAVYKQPQSTEPVLWHQDNGYTFVEPQAYLTCWIALTDATARERMRAR